MCKNLSPPDVYGWLNVKLCGTQYHQTFSCPSIGTVLAKQSPETPLLLPPYQSPCLQKRPRARAHLPSAPETLEGRNHYLSFEHMLYSKRRELNRTPSPYLMMFTIERRTGLAKSSTLFLEIDVTDLKTDEELFCLLHKVIQSRSTASEKTHSTVIPLDLEIGKVGHKCHRVCWRHLADWSSVSSLSYYKRLLQPRETLCERPIERKPCQSLSGRKTC